MIYKSQYKIYYIFTIVEKKIFYQLTLNKTQQYILYRNKFYYYQSRIYFFNCLKLVQFFHISHRVYNIGPLIESISLKITSIKASYRQQQPPKVIIMWCSLFFFQSQSIDLSPYYRCSSFEYFKLMISLKLNVYYSFNFVNLINKPQCIQL